MLKRLTSPALLLRASFAFALLTPQPATAEQRDPGAAQALFDQARTLTQKGLYAEACPKLLESNRLDPGIGTQFHLADCYEKNGQIATAWATFLDVASIARSTNQLSREKVATKRANLLEARLPRLTVNVTPVSHVEGLVVQRDRVQVGSAQWGVPVPVDPGEHELIVSAPGRESFKQTLKLEESKTATFEVPLLDREQAPAAGAPPVVPSQAPPTAALADAPMPAPTAEAKSSVGALPVVLAAAGVLGLGVGTVFGLKAQSNNEASKKLCDPNNPNSCDPAGVSQRNDARAQGNIATVGFIAGGAVLAAAIVVWRIEVGSPKKEARTSVPLRAGASVLPGSAALYLQGGF